MKKIIMLFSMAAMLLSMSLNAQNRINERDYLVGPYTSDEYSTPDYNLYVLVDQNDKLTKIGSVLTPADYQEFLGDTIVGFRIAISHRTYATRFFFSTMTGDISTSTTVNGNNVAGSWEYNLGGYIEADGWLTYYLSQPKVFTLNNNITGIWIGYEYYQDRDNVIAVNTHSSTHRDLGYYRQTGYNNKAYHDVQDNLKGDIAVQLILRGKPLPPPEGYTELSGRYSDVQNINFDGIIFEDQLRAYTHDNDHPEKYTYQLIESLPEGSSAAPRHTNSVSVPVYKTDSRVNGFYTAGDIAADVDHHLMVDVLNADVDMSLEKESMIYYYTLGRGKDELPLTHIAKVQNSANNNGSYSEVSDSLYYQHNKYLVNTFNKIDRWDGKNVMTGNYDQDYMSYIPIIWSWGDGTFNNRRYDWRDLDSLHLNVHNSYGAPYYRTGVGDVTFNQATTIERQTAGPYAHIWTDTNGDTCCLYNVYVDAYGYVPEAVNTVQYEPYKYRIWVEDPDLNDNEGLRGFIINEEVSEDGKSTQITVEDDGRTFDEIVLLTDDADKCAPGTNVTRMVAGAQYDPRGGNDYDSWLTFGATIGFQPKLRIRFYYKVVEPAPSYGDITFAADPPHETFVPEHSQALYYAVEDKDYAPSPRTSVIEAMSGAQVVSTTFYNMQGMQSSTPFNGVNIMVTRYSDGSTTTAKVIK